MIGSSFPSRASCVRSRPNWFRAGVSDFSSSARRLAGGRPAEEPQRLVAHLLAVHAQLLQDARGDALSLADEAQEQVLGPHVVVPELARLLDGQLQHPLRLGGEGDLAQGQAAARRRHHALHGLADHLEVEPQVGEHVGRDALSLADEAQKEVLGPDVVVLKAPGLLASEVHDLADAFGKFVLHEIAS